MTAFRSARKAHLVLAVIVATVLAPLAIATVGGDQARLLLPVLAVLLPLHAMAYLESRLEHTR